MKTSYEILLHSFKFLPTHKLTNNDAGYPVNPDYLTCGIFDELQVCMIYLYMMYLNMK